MKDLLGVKYFSGLPLKSDPKLGNFRMGIMLNCCFRVDGWFGVSIIVPQG